MVYSHTIAYRFAGFVGLFVYRELYVRGIISSFLRSADDPIVALVPFFPIQSFKMALFLQPEKIEMIMMKSIENKGITATIALKNKVAGKTKPLFGLAKTSQTADTPIDAYTETMEDI
jgi:hypothetical protein